MDIRQKELSLKLYNFLCDVIGTKQVVNKRRQIFAIKEDCSRFTGSLTISSGSKAEGLDLKESDFDQMFFEDSGQVFEQIDHVKYINKKPPLIMVTENVKPSFTKLLLHHPQSDNVYSDCIDWRTGRPYLSSAIFRQMYFDMALTANPGLYINGPCTSSTDGMFDHAVSLHCTNWISQAQPWITRTKYSWASNEVIRNILSTGVLFVPIGSKKSPFTDLEWRMSFSYAEKQLIFCFNHVQLLCYALLKIILKEIIKKTFGDLLCSYFMKTIMFWLCEENYVVFWRKEKLISCFMTCFRRLIYCVEHETCLHYFIPENNLFDNRFETQHKDLLSKLHGLHDLGWTCLLQTETLQSFSSYLQPLLLSNISLSSFFPSLYFLDITKYEISGKTASISRCISKIIRLKKRRDLYMYLLSQMCQSFAQDQYDEESAQGDNKELYRNLWQRLSNLLIGLNYDAVSGWLLLDSFFFTNKQYNISKILIDYSLTKFTPDICEIYHKNSLWQLRRYIEIQNITGLRCLKHFTINNVMMQKHSSIIPDELKLLVGNDTDKTIHSIVYAHILNFLFYRTTSDFKEKERSYRCVRYYCNQYAQFG